MNFFFLSRSNAIASLSSCNMDSWSVESCMARQGITFNEQHAGTGNELGVFFSTRTQQRFKL